MTTNHSRMDDNTKGRVQLIALRVLVYAILIFLTILCLFFFYLMIINATRSNAQLATGFTLLPKGNFFVNLKNAWNDASINIPRGMLNSLIIALSSAAITTYFSALTAYGVHVYNFRAKNFVFTFIMAVMMIPSQVSALGFLQLMNKFTASLKGLFAYKENREGEEKLHRYHADLSLLYRLLNKGTISLSTEYVYMKGNVGQNSTVSYFMLDGLNMGSNLLWTLSGQISVTQFLQVAVQYQGRAMQGHAVIHTGNLTLNALF